MEKIKLLSLSLLLMITSICCTGEYPQVSIKTVDAMPDFPTPYEMRDWDKVARELDDYIFDYQKKGQHLPLITFDKTPWNPDKEVFIIPSYVGIDREGTEGITCFGVLSGALIAGINKTEKDKNYIELFTNYYQEKPGLYLNDFDRNTGESFWYEIFPSVLFCRIFSFHTDSPDLQQHFTNTADNWYEACVGMGGRISPWTVPDFNHTAFSFGNMTPVSNGIWKEADVSAAIAWIEYIAYTHNGDEKYLDAARWSMDYLQQTGQNPYYEILMPYGAYTAARMNAELGTNYDTQRFINWCFDGTNPRRWGVTTGRWGEYDCAGLVGSVEDSDNMYAFAMNSFDMPAALVPITRYDDRFADAIGKWVLNLANSSRLFYSNGLPETHQTDYEWSRLYDPGSCIAYEGLRQRYLEIDRVEKNYKTISGEVISGSVTETIGTNNIYQCIEEDNEDRMEHVWELTLSHADEHELSMVGKTEGNDGENFKLSYSESPEGPYKPLFSFQSVDNYRRTGEIATTADKIYLKVTDSGDYISAKGKDRIYIDDIWVVSKSSASPFATGDAKTSGWGQTNLGVYGSGYVGILAGIIDKTNVEGILQLDCLKTDFFHGPAYPTYLYYNPHSTVKHVEIDLGQTPSDIYDSIDNKFIADNVAGKVSIKLNPRSSRLIVICPANGKKSKSGTKMLVDGVVVDYRASSK